MENKKKTYYDLLMRAVDYHEVLVNYGGFVLVSDQYEFFNDGRFHVLEISDCSIDDKVIRIGIIDEKNEMNFSFLTKSQTRQLRDYLTQLLEEM